jgi:hypothetical protein
MFVENGKKDESSVLLHKRVSLSEEVVFVSTLKFNSFVLLLTSK